MLQDRISSLVALESIVDQIIEQNSEAGVRGWAKVCSAHPSDIADLLEHISRHNQFLLFIIILTTIYTL